MIAAGWIAVCALLAQEPAAGPPVEPAGGTQARDAASARGTIAAWREDLELDLPRRVLAEGPPRVGPGGDLEHEGEAVALVARALFDAGRQEASAALLEAAKPKAETRPWVELERARQWIENDELERALRFLRGEGGEAVRFPAWPECWFLMGRARVRAGDEPLRAAPYLERFVELAPRHVETAAALHMLAQMALASGDAAAAGRLAERAQAAAKWQAYYRVRRLQIREQPDEPLPVLGLAQLWLEARELGRAKAVLEPLVERFPSFASGWYHLGEALRMEGDATGAVRQYDKALELDPGLGGARYNRAMIALREGRRAAARADLEHLVASPHGTEPRFVPAHLALARLLDAEGEKAAALARYERYVELGGREKL